jgi:hypothetical protein
MWRIYVNRGRAGARGSLPGIVLNMEFLHLKRMEERLRLYAEKNSPGFMKFIILTPFILNIPEPILVSG